MDQVNPKKPTVPVSVAFLSQSMTKILSEAQNPVSS